MPALVVPFAIWTVCVHAMVVARASFDTLLKVLPLVLVLALAATAGWFRLREATIEPGAHAPGPTAFPRPMAVLGVAVVAVAGLALGLPYEIFWWAALLAMLAAWHWTLRAPPAAAPATGAAHRHAGWIVAGVAAAAVGVVLFTHRPDADDAFHLSITTFLLRFPAEPMLLHDTLYRLPDTPLLLPFYRVTNYDVLVAVLARLSGIDHLVFAHVLLPALFAALAVVAWAHLLRRLVPERWPLVLPLLFACVLELGEAPRGYGNFAFVRLFQGKAILATCVVPSIAAAAIGYARHGGARRWLLLFASQVAALGFAASAMFVAPAAAALGLAGGTSPDRAGIRRFLLGLLASCYVAAAAWAVGHGPRGARILRMPSPDPMPGMEDLLAASWGPWSLSVLLVAMLSAWAFVRDPWRGRYFAAAACCCLLVALNPYLAPFVARHSVGVATYWRITWALPLPFFLAVWLDGVARHALALRPRVLAVAACFALLGLAGAYTRQASTLRAGNGVRLGRPTLEVAHVPFAMARVLGATVPENETVLAPQSVAIWLPLLLVRPHALGVRHLYLSLAFDPRETARRSNLMRYVGGKHRPSGAPAWFAEAVDDYALGAVVIRKSAAWRGEIQRVLEGKGWHAVSCPAYVLMRPPRAPRNVPAGCRAPIAS
ncbi:MAG TPA: DUF6077 domain-containing protein [Luteimonas sp.]|nr:DUF6077 domain-containing protein [Luteimonas sp.]